MRKNIHRLPGILSIVMITACLIALPISGSSADDVGVDNGTIDMPVKGVYHSNSSFYHASITASDIDGDGDRELLVGNTNGRLYCFDSSAQPVWTFDTDASIQCAPACCDVNGDGRQEIWVGNMDGEVWGLDHRGGVLSDWGWPKGTKEVGGLSGIFSSPAVGDINGDGSQDVVVGNYGQHIYAWDHTGRLLPGWPYNNEDTIWSSPALADLDWDGVKEVIIGADSTGGVNWPYPPGGLLYAFDGDGTILEGFPKVTPEVTWSSPAVVDIDGDARYEIVVGTGHYYSSIGEIQRGAERVYAYNHDGSPVKGWPVDTTGSTFSSPAIGDVDSDGLREVVIGTVCEGSGENDHINVMSADGEMELDIEGFGGPMMGSPALGDITGDGIPDMILGSGIQMCAWDRRGDLLWNQYLDSIILSSPAVGDFDNDGRVEVAVATGDDPEGSHHGGGFYVFDCGAKAGGVMGDDNVLFPWPMFRLNGMHHATVLTGEEPPAPPVAPSRTWYLAEGSTGGGMETWVLVQNPNDEEAQVSLTYMTSEGPAPGPAVTVPPNSRSTFNVAGTLAHEFEVSTRVTADKPVIVERAMYGKERTWAHESLGATIPKRTWYLAEGSTGGGMETWVLVQNPNEGTADVTLTYMTPRGPVSGPTVKLPSCSRRTFCVAESVPNTWGVSTEVTADRPVIVERAMYGKERTWAHDSIGTAVPSVQWYLAEGSTADGMETWVLVQNPTYPEAEVRINYMTPDGPVNGPTVTLPSCSRKTLHVADTVPNAWGVSTEVTADKPVIVERAMYGNGRAWGHDSIGATTPKRTWYLAEGSTADGMETWVLVQNPNDEEVRVSITYMTPEGPVSGPTVTLPPCSRRTFFVADTVPDAWGVSTRVNADKPVIVERAMYGGGRTWGHESVGLGL